MKRGSDENGSWLKLPNLGHDMAKTKYDWSGETVRILSLFSDVYLFAISTSYQFSYPAISYHLLTGGRNTRLDWG